MLYNNRGYTIQIPDEMYWAMSDDEFTEYINSRDIGSFNVLDDTHVSDISPDNPFTVPEE